MSGKDLFYGLDHVNAKFIDEAETVTQLKGEKKIHSLRRPVLIAATIVCAAYEGTPYRSAADQSGCICV